MTSMNGLIILVIACSLWGCLVQNTGEVITKPRAFPKAIERAKKDNRHFLQAAAK